jgi:hypothetical protein
MTAEDEFCEEIKFVLTHLKGHIKKKLLKRLNDILLNKYINLILRSNKDVVPHILKYDTLFNAIHKIEQEEFVYNYYRERLTETKLENIIKNNFNSKDNHSNLYVLDENGIYYSKNNYSYNDDMIHDLKHIYKKGVILILTDNELYVIFENELITFFGEDPNDYENPYSDF